MPKPTAQAMRAARALFEEQYRGPWPGAKEIALCIDSQTRLPALIEALANLVARSDELDIDMNRWGSVAHYLEKASYPRGLLGAKKGAMESARAALQDAEGSSDA